MAGTTTLRRASLLICACALMAAQPPTAFAQYDSEGSLPGTHIEGKTEVEKATAKCAVAVIGGALVGALIGGKNAGRGARIGASLGVGLCAVMMSVASDRDKEHLRQLQLQAMNTGRAQTQHWQTSEGKAASATITASPIVQVSTKKSTTPVKCRRTSTQLAVDGQQSSSSDIVCLQGDTWVTGDKLKSLGVRASDINA